MNLSVEQKALLRALPGVDRILELARKRNEFADTPGPLLVNAIRTVLEARRHQILSAAEDDNLSPFA